ncbi:unnamed protein product, partial [Owenia fusiformis]
MIPVVDFSGYSLKGGHPTPSEAELAPLADEIHKAFIQVGLFYMKNHGLDISQVVEEYMEMAKRFFDLPLDIKKKYELEQGTSYMYQGYHLHEHCDHEGSADDLKEAFNAYPTWEGEWPDEYVP